MLLVRISNFSVDHRSYKDWVQRKDHAVYRSGTFTCEMGFYAKVDVAKQLGLLDGKQRSVLLSINRFRNHSIHEVILECNYKLADGNDRAHPTTLRSKSGLPVHGYLFEFRSTFREELKDFVKRAKDFLLNQTDYARRMTKLIEITNNLAPIGNEELYNDPNFTKFRQGPLPCLFNDAFIGKQFSVLFAAMDRT